MNTIPVIKQACADALDAEEFHAAEYASVVDPLSVLEMAGIIEQLLQYLESTGARDLAADVRQRIY